MTCIRYEYNPTTIINELKELGWSIVRFENMTLSRLEQIERWVGKNPQIENWHPAPGIWAFKDSKEATAFILRFS
jgi:hypothetical protein